MGNHTLLLSILGAGSLLGACDASYQVGELGKIAQPVGCSADSDCAIDQICDPGAKTCLRPPETKNLDVLFMIDNSTSMSPMQETLARSITKFIQRIEAAGVSYHVGVVTSDVGTLPAPGASFPGAVDQRCNTFSGDDGLLQNVACSSRNLNVSADFRNVCSSLCPTPIVPSEHWIAREHGVPNVSDPVAAFKCMALVGDSGCGAEGQFESVKRALDGHLAANSGFLREDSLLAVIYITDEDDCSLKPSSRIDADPSSVDCATPDKAAAGSCFNFDYRCMARDVECDQPMNTAGVKTNCKERSSTWLEDVSSYVANLKSLRRSNRLFVSGIWSAPALDQGGSLEVAYQATGSSSPMLNRKRLSCAPTGSVLTSGPQLRLSKFAQSFRVHKELDLCLIDSYALALDDMAATMLQQAGVTSSK